jgi:mono/diheme cytochrome c family protein
MTPRFQLAPIILLFLTATSAIAADVGNGGLIAKRWCAACHIVASDQQNGSTEAPPFSFVAQKYADVGSLTAFLMAPYPRMPAMALSRDEIADLVAYIRTLGPKRAEPPPPPEKDNAPATDLSTRG